MAFRKNFFKSWPFYITIICVISGIFIAWQLRHNAEVKAARVQNPKADLVETIESLENETSQLEDELKKVREEINALQGQQTGGKNQISQQKKELEWQRALAGLVPVYGPGIIITLDDNKKGDQAAKKNQVPEYNPENYIIHDKDILYLVSELKHAGAEAISVNGQRIVTNSNIRCAGTVILINLTRLAPPYEIRSIGKVEQLVESIENGEEYPYLKYKGFPVSIKKSDNIVIPAYSGNFSFYNEQTVNPQP